MERIIRVQLRERGKRPRQYNALLARAYGGAPAELHHMMGMPILVSPVISAVNSKKFQLFFHAYYYNTH